MLWDALWAKGLRHDILHYIARRINTSFHQSSSYLTWFPCWCCTLGNRFCTIPGWFNCISLGGDCCCCKCCPWWWTGRAVMNVVGYFHRAKVKIVSIFTATHSRKCCLRWKKDISEYFKIFWYSYFIFINYNHLLWELTTNIFLKEYHFFFKLKLVKNLK